MNKNHKNRGYYRDVKEKAIERKYNIRKELWGSEETENYYNNVPKGTLSKGKIHCSCWMCQTKTDTCGWKKSDKKRLIAMEQDLENYYQELDL